MHSRFTQRRSRRRHPMVPPSRFQHRCDERSPGGSTKGSPPQNTIEESRWPSTNCAGRLHCSSRVFPAPAAGLRSRRLGFLHRGTAPTSPGSSSDGRFRTPAGTSPRRGSRRRQCRCRGPAPVGFCPGRILPVGFCIDGEDERRDVDRNASSAIAGAPTCCRSAMSRTSAASRDGWSLTRIAAAGVLLLAIWVGFRGVLAAGQVFFLAFLAVLIASVLR